MDMVESARQFRAAVQLYAGTLSDEEAVTVESLYPLWEAGAAYDKGALLRHGGRLYRVEQAHTAQAHQPPQRRGDAGGLPPAPGAGGGSALGVRGSGLDRGQADRPVRRAGV